MLKRGELVFAKVKGHSPWPAKILKKISPTQLKVFFFGTKQEGVVKETQVWDYEEYIETFSSRYGSRKLYALALQQASKIKVKSQAKDKLEETYENKELVFAKVKGYSPWPAQILGKHAPKIYNVFFYGTSETGKVKKENIWNYDAKREEFTAKYGKRKPYALALKQIREVASLASSKSTEENAPTSEETETGGKSLEETVAMFVDDEKIPRLSDINRMSTEENVITMLLDDQVDELVPTVSNMKLKDDEDVGKPIPMFEDEMLGLEETNIKVEMGNSVRMLRDRNQYENIPQLSRKNAIKDNIKKNRNFEKGSAEENSIKNDNCNNNDKESKKEVNPQKEVLKNMEGEKLDEEYPVAMLNTRTKEKNLNETDEIEEIEEIRRNDLVFKITHFSITTTFPASCSCCK